MHIKCTLCLLCTDPYRTLSYHYLLLSTIPSPIPTTSHIPSYPLHQWPYFSFIPYLTLTYPTILKLGRINPADETTQGRNDSPNQSEPKIRPNDPDRNDPRPETPGLYSMAWPNQNYSGVLFRSFLWSIDHLIMSSRGRDLIVLWSYISFKYEKIMADEET